MIIDFDRLPRVSHLSDSREEEALGTRHVSSYVTGHELAQQSQQSSSDTNQSFLKVIFDSVMNDRPLGCSVFYSTLLPYGFTLKLFTISWPIEKMCLHFCR